MQRFSRRFFLASLLAAAAAVIPLGRAAFSAENTPGSAPDHAKIKIVLAGDSTVTDNAGWGKGFASHLDKNVECINMSRGGRSSKSFIAEGRWQKCLDLHPDYLLIQFGHNDQPGHGPARETDPDTTYRQYMTQYVDDARAHHITPVLVTSLSRREWGADGKIHSSLKPYADVVKEIAEQKHVPLVDLQARSIALYEKLGKEGCYSISALKNAKKTDNADTVRNTPADGNPPPGKVFDGTHLNAKGSELIGAIVAEELKKAVPALAPHIK